MTKTQHANEGETYGNENKIMARLSLDWMRSSTVHIQASFTGARDHSEMQAPQYAGSLYNIYSADALAAANADPDTPNPYGYVNNELYAQFTHPTSSGYNASFLGSQCTAATRMNGVDSLNASPRTWAQISLADATRFILGTPVSHDARAASWSPGFLRGNSDWYYQGTLRADIDLSDAITLTSITFYVDKKEVSSVDGPCAARGKLS